jgi:hypothetical protein
VGFSDAMPGTIIGAGRNCGRITPYYIQNNGQIPSPIGHGSRVVYHSIITLESMEVGLKAAFAAAATVVRPGIVTPRA